MAVDDVIDALSEGRDARVELYKELHRSPELSMAEYGTSDRRS